MVTIPKWPNFGRFMARVYHVYHIRPMRLPIIYPPFIQGSPQTGSLAVRTRTGGWAPDGQAMDAMDLCTVGFQNPPKYETITIGLFNIAMENHHFW